MASESRRCMCGVDFVPSEGCIFDCPGIINTETGFSVGGDEGVNGSIEMDRFGGGKIKLTFNKGIVTEIEEEEE